ncbi:MAG: hypothetical protein IJW60_03190 [Clostridia bacterium]|nr:hypothetical protein [Clostridia bacterium]
MKKLKKVLSLLLCGAFCLLPIGCDNTRDSSDSSGDKPAETGSYIHLESFDSYKTVNRIWCGTSLGDASVDKTYVSEGDASLKVMVADPETKKDVFSTTTLYVPTEREEGDYHDFSMIDEVSLDVYGVEGTDMSVQIAVVLKGASVVSGPAKSFEVKAGEWTKVNFTVNRTVTDASIDVAKITHISISCSGTNATMCLDNLQLHRATSDFVSAVATVDAGELCNFEKAYQSFAVTGSIIEGKALGLSIISDPEWTTSGVRALKVVAPATNANNYWQIELSEQLFKASNFNEYTTDKYIAYDIYKPFVRSWWFTTRIRCNTSNAYDNVSTTVPEGIGWHTVCIPLTRRVMNTTNMQINFQSKNGLENGGKDGVTFYLDNFRIIDEVPEYGSVFVAPKEK